MENLADRVVAIVAADAWSMHRLAAVRDLGLPDWLIGGGFVRGLVWDALAGRAPRRPADVDVAYFDAENRAAERDRQFEVRLAAACPGAPWSVKIQARMHERNGDAPYADTADAIAHWLETATCVGVRLGADGTLAVIAPHGLADLVDGIIRPTPSGVRRREVYAARLAAKDWPARWPGLRILESADG